MKKTITITALAGLLFFSGLGTTYAQEAKPGDGGTSPGWTCPAYGQGKHWARGAGACRQGAVPACRGPQGGWKTGAHYGPHHFAR